LRNDGRNCRITASRARNSDIGSERENSRIGARRSSSAAFARDPFRDFLSAIASRPPSRTVDRERKSFAVQQASNQFAGILLTC
jgi:hypothetical protein